MSCKRTAAQLVLLLIASCFLQIWASDPALFYESFDEPFEERWIVSDKADYQGRWKHSKSDGHEDYGLLASEKARKYAIVKELEEPIVLRDGTVLLQFEVRLQNGLECGGAYLKYLRPQAAAWTPKGFDNVSPYTIMFGPDKCGSTNKVHFILQHKNPGTGKYVEHHLKYPPSVPFDKLTHVYTAILKPDNELKILVDGEEKKKANFLSADDFELALIPPKTIPDPDDKKPEDWDERAKIPDPDAVKPDDWDEDAPMEIEDEEAVKPDGWLDDEPDEIEDPESTKPEDWDDEEDGEWEAPKIDNPKCEEAPGCGEWKRPMKRNPAYKGKWSAPLIDNPNYKGIWKPQKIENPEYFELDKPNFELIAAIGIEIWTLQDGILFDNILVASDEKVAESFRLETWKPKYEAEKEKQKTEEAAAGFKDGLSGFQKKTFDLLSFLEPCKIKIIDFIEKAKKQATLTIGVLISIAVAPAAAAISTETNVKTAENDAPGFSDNKDENEKVDDPSGSRPRITINTQSCREAVGATDPIESPALSFVKPSEFQDPNSENSVIIKQNDTQPSEFQDPNSENSVIIKQNDTKIQLLVQIAESLRDIQADLKIIIEQTKGGSASLTLLEDLITKLQNLTLRPPTGRPREGLGTLRVFKDPYQILKEEQEKLKILEQTRRET